MTLTRNAAVGGLELCTLRRMPCYIIWMGRRSQHYCTFNTYISRAIEVISSGMESMICHERSLNACPRRFQVHEVTSDAKLPQDQIENSSCPTCCCKHTDSVMSFESSPHVCLDQRLESPKVNETEEFTGL